MKKSIFILLLLSLSGCATIFSGTTQKLNIKVVDANTQERLTGASCTIRNDDGNVYAIHSNPGTVEVSRNGGELDFTCGKEGYRQGVVMTGNSFNKTTLVNIIFWPGFLVDAATGSHKKYPTHFVVTMEKLANTNKITSTSTTTTTTTSTNES